MSVSVPPLANCRAGHGHDTAQLFLIEAYVLHLVNLFSLSRPWTRRGTAWTRRRPPSAATTTRGAPRWTTRTRSWSTSTTGARFRQFGQLLSRGLRWTQTSTAAAAPIQPVCFVGRLLGKVWVLDVGCSVKQCRSTETAGACVQVAETGTAVLKD